MNKNYKYITSIFTVIVITSFGVFSTLQKDKETSMVEGRTLQQIPTKVTFETEENNYDKNAFKENILDGGYFKKWDDYFNDQIIGRGTLVNKYASIQEVLKKTYIDDVILGDNGYFFTIPNNKVEETTINESANYYNSLKDEFNNSSIYIATYPPKDAVNSNYVPIKNYESEEEKMTEMLLNKIDVNKIDVNKVNVINLYDVMKGKEDLFYKTDHHWNMNGVYLGYETLIKLIGKEFPQVGEPKSKDSYNIEIYNKVFVGSDGRKVGQIVKKQEDIQLYRYDDEDKFKVTINEKAGQFYYKEYLDPYKYNNDYVTYIRGDNAETIVENTKANNNLTIAMIGDSMDNPLIPLMAENFNKIYSFDLRYYKDNLNKHLHEINPDIILINGLDGQILKNGFKITD